MNVYLCFHLALAAHSLSAHPPSLQPLSDFLHDDSGQDMIEYALIASFIGLSTVTGINGLAASVSNYLNIVDSAFTSSLGHN
jgi:pilus assembly protein Flp/PilA